jgi:protein TonB
MRPLPVRPLLLRYTPALPRYRIPWIALIVSAGLHGGIFWGFNHKPVRHHVAAAPPPMEVTLMPLPKIEDLDPPTDLSSEHTDAPAGVDVPALPDLPSSVNLEGAFVQEMDLSSLLPKTNLAEASLVTIPASIQHGGTGAGTGKLNKVFDISELDRAPTPVYQPFPPLSAALRRLGLSVKVTVEFVVNAKGEVIDPRVVDTQSSEYDEAATKGVLRWKFRPGIKNGKPVSTRIIQPIMFRYTDSES